jgi:hypothetical protein
MNIYEKKPAYMFPSQSMDITMNNYNQLQCIITTNYSRESQSITMDITTANNQLQ